jgi:hypothetical protein
VDWGPGCAEHQNEKAEGRKKRKEKKRKTHKKQLASLLNRIRFLKVKGRRRKIIKTLITF